MALVCNPTHSCQNLLLQQDSHYIGLQVWGMYGSTAHIHTVYIHFTYKISTVCIYVHIHPNVSMLNALQ